MPPVITVTPGRFRSRPAGGEPGWRKSSRSGTGNCVEAGTGRGTVVVRDSALDGSPVLEFSPASWAQFCVTLKEAP